MTMNIRDKRTQNRFFTDNTIILDYGWLLRPVGIAVYCALVMHADIDDQNCWPSHARIAKLIGASRRTVLKYIKLLGELGLIEWVRRINNNGSQTSNMYYLLDPPPAPDQKTYVYPEWMHTTASTPVQEMRTPCAIDAHPPVQELHTNNPNIEQSSLNKQQATPVEFTTHTVDLLELGPFMCPACEERIDTKDMRKNKSACPSCGMPLQITVQDNPWGHPPRRKQPKNPRTLGALFEDCPQALADMTFMENERQLLLRAYAKDRAVLFSSLQWTLDRSINFKVRIERAITAAATTIRKAKERDRKENQESRDLGESQGVDNIPHYD